MSHLKIQIKRRAWPEKICIKKAKIAKNRTLRIMPPALKTAERKATSSQNSLKHGPHSANRHELHHALRAQKALVKRALSRHDL